MSKGREIADHLNDILTAIAEVEDFTRRMSYDKFAADKKTINAVIRSLEVLGEATKRIPIQFRKKHPDIPCSTFISRPIKQPEFSARPIF